MKMNPKELNFTGEFVVPKKTPYETWQHHINRYLFASKIVKEKTVLDVACGVGYGSEYLAKKGAKFVVGGDYSKDALEYAKTCHRDNLEFIRLDARSLPLRSHYFNVIVSFETIEHLDNCRHFLSECNRALKKGGLFLLSTPNKKLFSHGLFHVQEFYPKDILKLLKTYFPKVNLYGQYYRTRLNVLKCKLFKMGAKILQLVPCGTRMKKILREILVKSPRKCDARLGEKIGECVSDKRYEILTFTDNFFRTPRFIVATALKSSK